jgi:hypothetical protein
MKNSIYNAIIMTGGVIQVVSTCLTSIRHWVQTPVLPKNAIVM